jgi:hypothetical protein
METADGTGHETAAPDEDDGSFHIVPSDEVDEYSSQRRLSSSNAEGGRLRREMMETGQDNQEKSQGEGPRIAHSSTVEKTNSGQRDDDRQSDLNADPESVTSGISDRQSQHTFRVGCQDDAFADKILTGNGSNTRHSRSEILKPSLSETDLSELHSRSRAEKPSEAANRKTSVSVFDIKTKPLDGECVSDEEKSSEREVVAEELDIATSFLWWISAQRNVISCRHTS